MSSITAYVINKDGSLNCVRTGNVDSVMYGIEIEKKGFTLQSPPNEGAVGWRWVNNKWIADKTAE